MVYLNCSNVSCDLYFKMKFGKWLTFMKLFLEEFLSIQFKVMPFPKICSYFFRNLLLLLYYCFLDLFQLWKIPRHRDTITFIAIKWNLPVKKKGIHYFILFTGTWWKIWDFFFNASHIQRELVMKKFLIVIVSIIFGNSNGSFGRWSTFSEALPRFGGLRLGYRLLESQ